MPNPVVDLFVYDVATRQSIKIDVRDGKPFDDAVVGHYVYHVVWSPDGRELLFFRTNRRQNVMEVAAANPATGACRVILREEWPTGWVNDQPRLVFLRRRQAVHLGIAAERLGQFLSLRSDRQADRRRSRRTRRSKSARSSRSTRTAGVVFYTARDGDNFLKFQLHRVGLDGKGDRRLTDPAFHHSVGSCLTGAGPRIGQPGFAAPCGISPDNKYFIDVYQTHDTPPATRIVDAARGRSWRTSRRATRRSSPSSA